VKRHLTALLVGTALALAPAIAAAQNMGASGYYGGPPGAGQQLGAQSNAQAVAGNVGEPLSNSLASGSAITYSTGTAANITNITSLTPGRWEVWGTCAFTFGGTTVVTQESCGISTTSATQPGLASGAEGQLATGAGFTGGADNTVFSGVTPIAVSAPTVVYLVGTCAFTTSTCKGYGQIQAVRRP